MKVRGFLVGLDHRFCDALLQGQVPALHEGSYSEGIVYAFERAARILSQEVRKYSPAVPLPKSCTYLGPFSSRRALGSSGARGEDHGRDASAPRCVPPASSLVVLHIHQRPVSFPGPGRVGLLSAPASFSPSRPISVT